MEVIQEAKFIQDKHSLSSLKHNIWWEYMV